MSIPVIAIIDIGKTNKKLFLFDESFSIVYEKSVTLEETTDEDGFACENLPLLINFVKDSLTEVLSSSQYDVRAINFSAYGASLVHVDRQGNPVCPLYNYLKPYPEDLRDRFYNCYGGEEAVSLQTASPVLGSLNSGMQLYRLKYEKPDIFSRIQTVLHLPQYVSYLVSGKTHTDLTSVGCHTTLWDFPKHSYHEWVHAEGLGSLFPPIVSSTHTEEIIIAGKKLLCGVGLHDSSAALIPYLDSSSEKFVLISSGTWSISLNPFNQTELTMGELEKDCLCYLTYSGQSVKASRFFAGPYYEQHVRRIAEHFAKPISYFKSVTFDNVLHQKSDVSAGREFADIPLNSFLNEDEAYHCLVRSIITKQVESTNLVLHGSDVNRIYVDGGFSINDVFMNMLARAYPQKEIYSASLAQGTSLGAALAISQALKPMRNPLTISLVRYGADKVVLN